MDATSMDTFTGTVGIGYHHQALSAHQKAGIAMGDDHHTPGTPTTDEMTEGAVAGPTLDITPGTEVQATQDTTAQIDTPVETDIPCEYTHQITTELRADHLIDIAQAATDHQPPTPGTAQEAGHHHAVQSDPLNSSLRYAEIFRRTKRGD